MLSLSLSLSLSCAVPTSKKEVGIFSKMQLQNTFQMEHFVPELNGVTAWPQLFMRPQPRVGYLAGFYLHYVYSTASGHVGPVGHYVDSISR